MKKIFLFLLVGLILWPTAVWGAVVKPIKPEFNPICWKEDECIKLRKNYGAADVDAKDGFLSLESPCNQEGYGKCLPAGVAKTQIKFGGQSQFSDIGEFILVNYNYVLGIAGILAAIMIVIAGAQYVTSGGNSEAIGSAKKRIGGALVGMLIAYLSYVILNTINPALVNLRLPQTFMIRPQALAFSYCNQSPSSSVFADAGTTEKNTTADDFAKITDFPLTLSQPEKLVCGHQFFVNGANGATCLGSFCPPVGEAPQLCAPDFAQPRKKLYVCRGGIIGGSVTHVSMMADLVTRWLTEEWQDPPIDDNETELWSVCNDGDTTDVSKGDYGGTVGDKHQSYLIDAVGSDLDTAAKDCERNHKGLKGFVLMFEMNEANDPTDEEHLIGWDGGNAKDLGDEGFFNQYVTRIKKQYFIPLENLKKGIIMDLEASTVKDIDDPTEDVDWKDYMKLLE
jgi:hypothetical protein